MDMCLLIRTPFIGFLASITSSKLNISAKTLFLSEVTSEVLVDMTFFGTLIQTSAMMTIMEILITPPVLHLAGFFTVYNNPLFTNPLFTRPTRL